MGMQRQLTKTEEDEVIAVMWQARRMTVPQLVQFWAEYREKIYDREYITDDVLLLAVCRDTIAFVTMEKLPDYLAQQAAKCDKPSKFPKASPKDRPGWFD